MLYILATGYMVSRCLSGIGVITLPKANASGTVAEFSQEHGGVFSAEALHELETGIGTLKNLFVTAMQALENGDKDIVAKVSKDKNKIRKLQKQNNKAHMARIKKNTCSSDLTMQYSNMLYNIDRIADNCVSISEEAMDNISFQKLYQNNAEQDQSLRKNL